MAEAGIVYPKFRYMIKMTWSCLLGAWWSSLLTKLRTSPLPRYPVLGEWESQCQLRLDMVKCLQNTPFTNDLFLLFTSICFIIEQRKGWEILSFLREVIVDIDRVLL